GERRGHLPVPERDRAGSVRRGGVPLRKRHHGLCDGACGRGEPDGAGVLADGEEGPGPGGQAGIQGEAQCGLLLLQQGERHRALPQLLLAGARRLPGEGGQVRLCLRHRQVPAGPGEVSEEREQDHLGGHRGLPG
ncbi:hypothetical protein PBMFNG_PBMFNG_04310, partial [Dysosmobacter welbionis]